MNSKEFVRLLRTLSESAGFAGDSAGSEQLKKVADVFDSVPESSLNRTLVKRLRSLLAKDSQMFQRALQHLKFFRQASVEIARKSDLESLDAVIDGINDNDKPKRPAKPKPVPLESELAHKYLAQLSDAGGDLEAGQKILDDLQGNKAVDIAQLNWLVQQYAGGSTVYVTRPKALARMSDRLTTIARRGEKSDEIKRLTDTN